MDTGGVGGTGTCPPPPPGARAVPNRVIDTRRKIFNCLLHPPCSLFPHLYTLILVVDELSERNISTVQVHEYTSDKPQYCRRSMRKAPIRPWVFPRYLAFPINYSLKTTTIRSHLYRILRAKVRKTSTIWAREHHSLNLHHCWFRDIEHIQMLTSFDENRRHLFCEQQIAIVCICRS